jgi:aryl-alcohol dehydrogenase-like predicted oxidoreductase
LGVDHWDVAEIYGEGACETVIGKFLVPDPGRGEHRHQGGDLSKATRHFRNDEEALRRSLEGSLTRLGRDRVELFYIHRREAERPVEEVMETLVGFIEEGLIGCDRSVGGRARDPAPGPCGSSRGGRTVGILALVPAAGARLDPACAELGTTFVAFSPVGRGVFADRFPDASAFPPGDFRSVNPRFMEPNYSANKAAIAPFQDWCHARGWSTSAVERGLDLHRGEHVLPIPGTRSAAHLRDWCRPPRSRSPRTI